MRSKIFYENLQNPFFYFLLLSLPLLIYGFNMPTWWMCDDTIIIKHTMSSSLIDNFFDPETWQKFSPANLTPYLILIFKIALSVFKFNPVSFYLIHFIISGILLLVLFFFLRKFLSFPVAIYIVTLFALSPAFANNLFFLMTSHYTDGLIWTLLAIYFFILSLETKKQIWSYIGALCYLIAILAKEIYVPLIFLLPFIFQKYDSFSKYNFKYFLPFLFIALLYPLYRKWMLGVWLGGYGQLYQSPPIISGFWLFFNRLTLNHPWVLLIIIAFGIFGISGKNFFKNFLFVIVISFIILFPISQILGVLSFRHLFLPTCALLIWFGFGLNRCFSLPKIHYKIISIICSIVILSIFILNNITIRNFLETQKKLYKTQGLFFWNASRNEVLLDASLPMWYFLGLKWIKIQQTGNSDTATVIQNTCIKWCIEKEFFSNKNLEYYFYDIKSNSIKLLSKEDVKNLLKSCKCKKNSLIARIWQKKQYIYWNLGPYKSGKYFLVENDSHYLSIFPLPPKGYIRGKLKNVLKKEISIICYKSPKLEIKCKKPIIDIFE